jgi:hypothetical protein
MISIPVIDDYLSSTVYGLDCISEVLILLSLSLCFSFCFHTLAALSNLCRGRRRAVGTFSSAELLALPWHQYDYGFRKCGRILIGHSQLHLPAPVDTRLVKISLFPFVSFGCLSLSSNPPRLVWPSLLPTWRPFI